MDLEPGILEKPQRHPSIATGKTPWRYAAAVGLCLLAMPLAAQETSQTALESEPVAEPRQPNGATTGEQSTEQDLSQVLAGVEAAIRDLIAEERANQTQGPTDYEARDLKAQEEMAFWAKAMFWATLAAAVIAVAGVVYVRNTLFESRRIGRAQVRAYLSCGSATYRASKDGLTITPVIVNSGQSPALNTRFNAYIDVQHHTPDLTTNSRSRSFEYSGPPVSAGGSAEGEIYFNNPEHFGEREAATIATGRARFDVVVTVHWRDVFGQDNSARFQLMAGIEYGKMRVLALPTHDER